MGEGDASSNIAFKHEMAQRGLRTQRGRLSRIAVVEVNRENLNTIWPYLLTCIRNASFISVDLELSGLGVKKGWSAKDVQLRYETIRESARTRSILSLGISTFRLLKRKETDQKKRIKYSCQVFNMLTLREEPFVVEPGGLQFLAKHNFDFNRLIQLGITYHSVSSFEEDSLKSLWREILIANVPLTLHNGLVDLIFLYQHFYSELPLTLAEFLANISDWFAGAASSVFDSKYLAEFSARMNASYLEYVFRKCQRDNAVEASCSRAYLSVEFDDLPSLLTAISQAVDVVGCGLPQGFYEPVIQPVASSDQQQKLICSRYAAFGFCKRKEKCQLLHNVDLVLDLEERKQMSVRERRKRRYDYATKGIRLEGDEKMDDTGNKIPNESCTDGEKLNGGTSEANVNNELNSRSFSDMQRSVIGCHRAGVDSFMTGFAVCFMSRMSLLRNGSFNHTDGNRLPLTGKESPLMIRRSEYTRQTTDHIERWKTIEKERERNILYRSHLSNQKKN